MEDEFDIVYRQLFRKYYANLLFYATRMVGEEDAEDVNPCKKKHVSNMRASGSDDTIRLIPPKTFSLEQALEHINDDELVEVTPKNIRMRKKILDRVERGRQRSRNKA